LSRRADAPAALTPR